MAVDAIAHLWDLLEPGKHGLQLAPGDLLVFDEPVDLGEEHKGLPGPVNRPQFGFRRRTKRGDQQDCGRKDPLPFPVHVAASNYQGGRVFLSTDTIWPQAYHNSGYTLAAPSSNR